MPQAGPAQQSAAPNEFRVDAACRIYETAPSPKGPVEHIYKDRGICAVDPMHSSSRTETEITTAGHRRTNVRIQEHTFALHNPTREPAVFVLEQGVPKGWQIDSDPRPESEAPSGKGTIATYRLHAAPGQTVELHVGMRNPPD